jgi:threonine dehydrogenase-like Zn-dependent dehydrogenase
MKCDAVWVVEPNKIEIRPIEIPDEPAWNEVQIEVKACGVCAWDSYLFQGISAPGPIPYAIGHEAVGIVRKAGGGVKDLKPGDKVYTANGGNTQMSQYINNPASGAAKIPDDVTDYAKWVIEPTCCVVNLLNHANIQPGDRIAVVGAGYMGLLTLMGLTRGSHAGYITVFEVREDRRKMAEKLNPDFVFDPYSEEGKKHIREINDGGGADIVIDFAGSESGYEVSSSVLKDRAGKLILGTWHRHNMKFDGTRWHLGGVTVLNISPMFNPFYNETIVRRTAVLVEKGIYTPAELVTHAANYKDCTDVFLKSISKEDGYMKGVVTF